MPNVLMILPAAIGAALFGAWLFAWIRHRENPMTAEEREKLDDQGRIW